MLSESDDWRINMSVRFLNCSLGRSVDAAGKLMRIHQMTGRASQV